MENSRITCEVKDFSNVADVRSFLEQDELFDSFSGCDRGDEMHQIALLNARRSGEPTFSSEAFCEDSVGSSLGEDLSPFSTPSCFIHGKWLFLSVVKNEEEHRIRRLEFQDFQRRCALCDDRVTRNKAMKKQDIKDSMTDFLDSVQDFNKRVAMIVLGHGVERGDNDSGVVTCDGDCSNTEMIEHVREVLGRRPLRKTYLCLYYCHARSGNTETHHPHFKVVVYRKEKPLTIKKTRPPPSAKNTALLELAAKAERHRQKEDSSVTAVEKKLADVSVSEESVHSCKVIVD